MVREETDLRQQIRRARGNFTAMAATYFLGVFNDNFFKQAAMLTAALAGPKLQGDLMVVFTLPFIIFAAPAGWAADKFSKRTVVVGSKFLELAAMGFGAYGVITGNWLLIFTMLGLMATQSAIFSPSLNGSIPELYPASYITKANAFIKVITTAAILVGIASAGFALARKGAGLFGYAPGQSTVAAVVVCVSLLGVLVSFGVPRRRAAAPGTPFPWLGILDTLRTLKATGGDKLLAITIGANALLWFVASLQILLITALGMAQFKLGEVVTSELVVAELVGVAAGGLIAGRISHGRRWYRLLWPSAFALGLFMVVMAFAPQMMRIAGPRLLFAPLAAMGVAGGIFLIPIESFIQARPAADRKGAVLSAANFAAFFGMLLSGPFFNVMTTWMTPTDVFAVAGGIVLMMSAWLAAIWHSGASRRSPAADAVIRRATAVLDAVIGFGVRRILSLRYRVKVSGIDEIVARGTSGVLFLPNHPALIDPFIVLLNLHKHFQPRFLADRDQINRPVVGWLAAHFGVRAIPDVAKYGPDSKRQIDDALVQAIKGLKAGDNWLLYPAGRIRRQYLEDLGGNSAVEKILRETPDVRIVLIRTRGLWGSLFSRAKGKQPLVMPVLAKGFVSLLKSGIFFAPRREVTIEAVEPEDLPRTADRFVINRYLENFYNTDARHNTYVPYTIWEKGGVRELPETGAREGVGAIAVAASTREAVLKRLREMTGIKAVSEEQHLGRELGLDSLARVDLSVWLADEFGFPLTDAEALQTVADVMEAASGQTLSAVRSQLERVPRAWFAPKPMAALSGATVAEAFLAQAKRTPGKVIIADQTSGALTFRDVVTAVMVLKREVEKLPGRHIGIMLPATVAVDLVYLATLFAGKTPVMVNWTVGSRNMTHSLDLLNVKAVLTARPVVKRVEQQTGDLGGLAGRFVYLEEVRKRIGRTAKLRAWVKSRLSWRELEEARVSDTAVVLFTSGSESLPKAVPLTHRNILTNVADGLEVLTFRADDSIMGLFPPFHSFGVTCNMMLALVAGVRTVYHPNPTEGLALARLIEAYRTTLVFGTPTFLKGIVRAATGEQLASLRLAVSGAEKCPESIYEALAKRCPRMVMLEGYGVTECSPVISVNDQRAPKAFTIGKVVRSLEYAIVDVETGKRAQTNAQGLLIVRGPSVFGGYLNYDGESPFVEFEGKTWYRTGDIVSEDEDGVLTFRGRVKRFVKIGGEMISLPAVEAVLDLYYASDDDKGPVIAVEATADEARPELVLFTTKETDRETVNKEIRAAGLSPLYQISRVVRLAEIPLLGTGKTDYRALRRMLAVSKI